MSKLLSNSLNNNQNIVSSKSLSQLFIEDFQIQHGKTFNSDVPKRKQEPKKTTLYTLYFLDLLLSHVIVGKRKFQKPIMVSQIIFKKITVRLILISS